MPDLVKYSEVTPTQTSDVSNNALVSMSNIVSNEYVSGVVTMTTLGTKLNNNVEYATALQTTNKTIIGAINELKELSGLWLTGTLTAGQTSLVLSNEAITTDSIVDNVYVPDTYYGVNPTNILVATGSVTLTFPVQSSDLPVKVRIL